MPPFLRYMFEAKEVLHYIFEASEFIHCSPKIPVPCMADNHPEDKYFYEIIVETGPKDSHATTANIYFILAGGDEESGAR